MCPVHGPKPTWAQTEHRAQLVETLCNYGRVAVAFSGGIDSTVVAQAAFEALGDAAIAVTAVSESLAAGELEEAQELARESALPTGSSAPRSFPIRIMCVTMLIAATFARASCMGGWRGCWESWEPM